MTPGRCFLIPGQRQERIVEKFMSGVDIVIRESDIFHPDEVVRRATMVQLEQVAASTAEVLCLTETAVYVAGLVGGSLNVGFDESLLGAVSKTRMHRVMADAGLPTIPSTEYVLGSGDAIPTDPPFVIKPDFGFASQLAMRITNLDDWMRFLLAARKPSLWAARKEYADALFGQQDGLLDIFVVQPDLSNMTFLSVSFVYIDGVAVSFATSGTKTESGEATSFAWRGFAAPAVLPQAALDEIDTELAAVAKSIKCRNGVYGAELLWDDSRHWYLEFEPRPQSGLIPDLTLHAFGVDVDDLAIRLFTGRPVQVPRREAVTAPTHLGLRSQGGREAVDAATLVQADEHDSAGTVLRDEVWLIDGRR